MNSICNNTYEIELKTIENNKEYNHYIENDYIENDNEMLNENIKKLMNDNENISKIIIHSYFLFFHIFVFSIFESFFFWFYITNQENKVLENQLKDVKMIGELICTNYDIDLDALITYFEKENNEWNNSVPRHNTIMLNGILFSILCVLIGLMKLKKLNILIIHKKILKKQSLLYIFLFSYEYFFFQNIIYTYHPTSIINIYKKTFHMCLD